MADAGLSQELRQGGRWLSGVSGNPAGSKSKAARRERRLAIISEWLAPHGGMSAFSAADITLLHEAAEVTLRRHRTPEEQTRSANVVSKIFAQIGLCSKDRGPRAPVEPEPPPPAKDDGWMEGFRAKLEEAASEQAKLAAAASILKMAGDDGQD
jgi:hypothetical protein